MPELDRSKIKLGLTHFGQKGETTDTLGVVDCSYGGKHAEAHQPHRVTERLVCCVCHPPAYLLDGGR